MKLWWCPPWWPWCPWPPPWCPPGPESEPPGGGSPEEPPPREEEEAPPAPKEEPGPEEERPEDPEEAPPPPRPVGRRALRDSAGCLTGMVAAKMDLEAGVAVDPGRGCSKDGEHVRRGLFSVEGGGRG